MFQPKISITSDCEKIIVSDITRSYDANTNPGGWGAPNPVRASVTSITLQVFKPGTTDSGTPSSTHDLLTDAPPVDVNGDYNYELLAADLNVATITSGVWRFRVVIDDGGTEYIVNEYGILYAEIAQLVNGVFKNLDPHRLEEAENIGCLDMWLLLQAAICGCEMDHADRIIAWLYNHYQDCC